MHFLKKTTVFITVNNRQQCIFDIVSFSPLQLPAQTFMEDLLSRLMPK